MISPSLYFSSSSLLFNHNLSLISPKGNPNNNLIANPKHSRRPTRLRKLILNLSHPSNSSQGRVIPTSMKSQIW